ncbi:hypothetical protein IQ265_18190 [Nodosilinea sp. LEGE 06152]|uniref:hypothetical protein n=1 Tax=Nodosilinea sp. LEGE 06152 TaxID=2777966 RepID=UPI0018804178|nr:hypothetical protein [Nodosilinea sp. LEGE 06152]MBE9158748.1 hypothetical protein [Nodosilinea sp. LEGE 06152]
MTIRESVEPHQLAEVDLPEPQRPRPRGTKYLTQLKRLVAPLLGLSLGLHGLVLFTPVPSRPEPAAEEAPTEEEFVDLLSISSLPEAAPEPVEPPPAAETAPPPPQAAAPAAPTQPVIPEVYPSSPLPVADLANPLPPAEDAFTAAPPPEEPAASVPDDEVVDLLTRLTRGSGESDFDSTETSFPAIAYLTRGGIGEWSSAEQSCFFTQISDADYRLLPNAASLRYLTRNVQFIETEDIPRTFSAPQFQVSKVDGGYCDRPLFQVLQEGQPYLFVSVVGIGVGAPGRQASGLVIIWATDPRAG